MQVGEAFITVRPDTKGFSQELSRETEKGGRQAASGLSQALTAGIAVAGFSKLIGAASGLQEAGNKVSETFGSASGQVEDFASTSAESLGISESAALSLAGGLGSMLIPLGIGQEEAAGMSTAMLTLAADMGSFNDQDPTEMLERIRAGLAGESEPLRQFGANLSEARVQQFAWANGIADSGEALDEQQKVMARYGLLLQDTSIQQGDFARTAGSAANAQRSAAAAAEDSAANIGENFLPVYEQAVAAVTMLAEAFGALPGSLQTGLVALGGYVAFGGPIRAAFGSMAGSVGTLKNALVAIRAAFIASTAAGSASAAAMLAAAGPWAALAGILVAVHTGLIDVTNAMSESDLDTANVDKMTAAMLEADSTTEGLIDHLSDATEFDPSFFDAIGVSVDTFAEALLGGEEEWDSFVDRVTTNLPAGANLDQWNSALETHRDRALASADAFVEQTGASEGAAGGMDDAATAAQDLAAAYDELSTAVDEYLNKVQGTEEANAAASEAQLGFFEALATNGAIFDADTRRGRENIAARNEWVDAVGGQVQAAIDYAAAGGNEEVAQRRANNAIRDGIGDLRAMRDAGLITQAQFREYSGVLRNIPHRVETELDADTRRATREVTSAERLANRVWHDRRFLAHLDADERDTINAYNNAVALGNAWDGKYYTADFRANIPPAIRAPTEQAAGGPFNAGEAYLVGERGPELRVEGHSGYTFTAAQTRSILANGGAGTPVGGAGGMNVTVVVEGNVIGDVDRFADEIAFRAAEKISRGAL